MGLSGDQIPFYVSRDARESNLSQLAAVDRKLLADVAGLSQNTTTKQTVGTSRANPIWPLLLLLLIAVITGELVLSGLIARQRFGSDSIAETTEDWMQDTSTLSGARAQAASVAPSESASTVGASEKETAGV